MQSTKHRKCPVRAGSGRFGGGPVRLQRFDFGAGLVLVGPVLPVRVCYAGSVRRSRDGPVLGGP
eukprot:6070892-Pyramimonas_sp.AAC.1